MSDLDIIKSKLGVGAEIRFTHWDGHVGPVLSVIAARDYAVMVRDKSEPLSTTAIRWPSEPSIRLSGENLIELDTYDLVSGEIVIDTIEILRPSQ